MGWGMACEEEVLEGYVLGGASVPFGCDTIGAFFAIPIGGWDTVEVRAAEMERAIAAVTDDAGGARTFERLEASCTWGGLQKQLAGSLPVRTSGGC